MTTIPNASRRLSAAAAAAAFCLAGPPARADVAVTTLATLNGTTLGSGPYGGLVADLAGNLYGTTSAGGAHGDGTVFELSGTNHQTVTTLYSFAGGVGGGATPYGALTVDAAGNLYGTTELGGASNDGTAFELSGTTHQTLTTLATFNGSNGSLPLAGLTFDAAGNLYGTAATGGAGGAGTVFKLSGAAHTTLTTLVAFNSANGGTPYAPVYVDGSGNLFGTTAAGVNGLGTAFELAGAGTAGQALTTLVAFGNTAAGEEPTAGLVADAAGNLYGTARYGGPSGGGTVYELSGTNHTTLTTLAAFNTSNGSKPYAGLIVDAAGNLYGTTVAGGANGYGTAFELSGTNHSTLTTLASFKLTNGANPYGGLTADAAGVLYGTTYAGGNGTNSTGNGSAFALAGVPFVLPAVNVSGGSYTFNAGTGVTHTAGINVDSNSSTSVTVAPSATPGTRQVLVIGYVYGLVGVGDGYSSTAQINLTNNDLVVSQYTLGLGGPPSSVYGLRGYTAAAALGYDDGKWDGGGTLDAGVSLVSSTAAADPTRTTAVGLIENDQDGTPLYTAATPFDGYVPGATDLLAKYTYYGDANLDGTVDGRDYSQIDTGFAAHGTLTGWYWGDFNYDGRIDASDYTLIDNAFNKQAGTLATAVLTAAATDEVTPAAAAVPEPAGVWGVTPAAVGLLRRRRRGGRPG